MPSLTPSHRSTEATDAAMHDGLIAGGITLIPSSVGVWAAMKNPKFVKATNWQSRTALAIMPALFMFAFSSEQKLSHKMHEMASESNHSKELNEWAEKNMSQNGSSTLKAMNSNVVASITAGEDPEKQLMKLYRKSVEESGVRIVPGDSLGIHHKMANFWQENPFKILAAVGIPSVLYIFKGRNDKAHLQLQMKLMHTRVFGQFTIVTMLLTLMGFKTYMDSHGKFITELEAQRRVEEMQRMREDLMARIALDKKIQERRREILRQAAKKED